MTVDRFATIAGARADKSNEREKAGKRNVINAAKGKGHTREPRRSVRVRVAASFLAMRIGPARGINTRVRIIEASHVASAKSIGG